jgi:hypothetical protein
MVLIVVSQEIFFQNSLCSGTKVERSACFCVLFQHSSIDGFQLITQTNVSKLSLASFSGPLGFLFSASMLKKTNLIANGTHKERTNVLRPFC